MYSFQESNSPSGQVFLSKLRGYTHQLLFDPDRAGFVFLLKRVCFKHVQGYDQHIQLSGQIDQHGLQHLFANIPLQFAGAGAQYPQHASRREESSGGNAFGSPRHAITTCRCRSRARSSR